MQLRLATPVANGFQATLVSKNRSANLRLPLASYYCSSLDDPKDAAMKWVTLGSDAEPNSRMAF